MDVEATEEIVASIQATDECRRESFQKEYEASEGESALFPETRQLLKEERVQLDRLKNLLTEERENIEELAERTDFLTAEQAVRHRDHVVSKLQERNRHLTEFHGEMTTALDVIESNLDTLAGGDAESISESPEEHLDAARTAIEKHNEAVRGLDDNLEILNAYLM